MILVIEDILYEEASKDASGCEMKTGANVAVIVYTLEDLEKIFPFGKSKLLKLCKIGALPVIKVGKDYISNPSLIDRWFLVNEGKEILY